MAKFKSVRRVDGVEMWVNADKIWRIEQYDENQTIIRFAKDDHIMVDGAAQYIAQMFST